ncbi:hypothetical protein DPMN_037910 [Dreissena polymorpha]|uniref:Uncharacterized protein n=1 Tax=Dreissena polymorpha TaxID=45954 RepID=A0A9D4MFC5_DREPO|nr:hypothetical protein DPMN_037910 [Dreissena polymorpha]
MEQLANKEVCVPRNWFSCVLDLSKYNIAATSSGNISATSGGNVARAEPELAAATKPQLVAATEPQLVARKLICIRTTTLRLQSSN